MGGKAKGEEKERRAREGKVRKGGWEGGKSGTCSVV